MFGDEVDETAVVHGLDAVDQLARHAARDPLQVLACLGGREIAAMAGAMARARVYRIPLILDGFIACSAALVLHSLTPAALDHAVAGHLSAEGAHGRLLAALGKEPLLSLGLRLGEGSGAGRVWALLPVINSLTTHTHLGVSLPAREWVWASMDLSFLATGLLLGWLAWRVRPGRTPRRGAPARSARPARPAPSVPVAPAETSTSGA